MRPLLTESERERTASLGGLCLFLSGLEFLLPRPLPFLRLGLANIPLLLSLTTLSPAAFAALVLLKTCAAAVLGGTLFSYVFLLSFAGSLASGLVMYSFRPLLRRKLASLLGASLTGALASNSAQLLLAALVLPESAVRLIAPPLIACGLATGLLLGVMCERIRNGDTERECGTSETAELHSVELHSAELHSEVSANSEQGLERDEELGGGGKRKSHFPKKTLIPIFLATAALALLFLPTYPRTAFFVCVFVISLGMRKERRPLAAAAMFLCFVLGNLLVPYGKTLFSIGSFPVTQGALETGLRKASAVQGLFLLSRLLPPLPISRRFPLLAQTIEEFSSLNRRFSRVRTPSDIMRVVRTVIYR